MDINIKNKWVEALRSGKYKQGTGKLRKCDDTFCCLGVLIDVTKPNSWEKREEDDFFHLEDFWYGTLPPEMASELDLVHSESQLMAMNDHMGYNFNQIADWIEANL